jgi:hypothetical protein
MDDGIVWLLIVIGIGVLCMMPTFYKLSREERRQSSLIDVLLKQGFRCEDPRREDAYLEGMCRGYAVRVNRSRMEQAPRRVAEPAREEGLIDSVFNALPSGGRTGFSLEMGARTALLRVTLTRALPAGLWVGRRGRALRPDRAELVQVQIGAPELDEGLSVYAADVSAAGAFLAQPAVREGLVRLMADGWMTLEDGALCGSSAGVEPELVLVRLHKLISIALILDAREAPVDDAMLAAFERPVGSS